MLMGADIRVLLPKAGIAAKSINMKRQRDPPHAPNTAIKAVRVALGLTQEQFGQGAKIPQSTIARLESGYTETKLSHIRKLVAAWGGSSGDYVPATEGFGADDNAQLAARAARVARRLAGDDEWLLELVAGLAYVFLDLERRGENISDNEETLVRIEEAVSRHKRRRP